MINSVLAFEAQMFASLKLGLTPRHFRRWGGLYAHTRKKKKNWG